MSVTRNTKSIPTRKLTHNKLSSRAESNWFIKAADYQIEQMRMTWYSYIELQSNGYGVTE
jgi:hypothetical protein